MVFVPDSRRGRIVHPLDGRFRDREVRGVNVPRVLPVTIGPEGRGEAVYALLVLPPWYQTWWAYGLYMVLLGAVVFVVLTVAAFFPG